MFRKYVIITLAAVLCLSTASCTSKKAEDDSADVQAGLDDDESLEAAEASENNSDLSVDDGGEAKSGEAVAENESTGGDELSPEEKLPSEEEGKVAENSEVTSDDLSEAPAAEESSETQVAANDETAPTATPEPTDPTAEAPPPAEMAATEAPPAEESAPVPEPEYEAPKPTIASLKKVSTQPWKAGKTLVNAVYIVRNGDTADSISQKLFGAKDKVKQLCKVNSFNCNRGLKVGDKMYYNSPQRPTDDTIVKTFYEDAGIAPQTYTAKAGDNIKNLGKTLLGHERSWMELWATNDVESKGDLDEGTQLRYWSSDAAPTQMMAANESPTEEAPADAAVSGSMPPTAEGEVAAAAPPAEEGALPPGEALPAEGVPPAQDLAAAPPPPAPSEQPSSDLPPPPDQASAGAAAGSIEPPPPPPPPPPAENQMADASAEMQDPNQTMALGVAAVLLLAAAALFISIRKKRQRRSIDFNTTTQTQID